MARITVKLDDELDKEVRTEISKGGGKKGDLAITVAEALRLWLAQKKKIEKPKEELHDRIREGNKSNS